MGVGEGGGHDGVLFNGTSILLGICSTFVMSYSNTNDDDDDDDDHDDDGLRRQVVGKK